MSQIEDVLFAVLILAVTAMTLFTVFRRVRAISSPIPSSVWTSCILLGVSGVLFLATLFIQMGQALGAMPWYVLPTFVGYLMVPALLIAWLLHGGPAPFWVVAVGLLPAFVLFSGAVLLWQGRASFALNTVTLLAWSSWLTGAMCLALLLAPASVRFYRGTA